MAIGSARRKTDHSAFRRRYDQVAWCTFRPCSKRSGLPPLLSERRWVRVIVSGADIASQGASIEEARTNLVEALTLFLENRRPIRGRAAVSGWVGSDPCQGSEICRILEQHGFRSVGQWESHRIMQKRTEGTTVTVPVPLHNPVRAGTLSSIVRQSGLPQSIFE